MKGLVSIDKLHVYKINVEEYNNIRVSYRGKGDTLPP